MQTLIKRGGMKKVEFGAFLFIILVLFSSFKAQQKQIEEENGYHYFSSTSNNVQWARTYGGWSDDWGGQVLEKKNSEGYILYYATATFDYGGTQCGDIWILDLSPSGDINWQRTYGGNEEELLYGGMQETRDGGYIVAGFTRSFSVPIGEHDFWILKLTSNGDIEWQYVFGGENMDFPYSIQETEDGGYIVAGTTYSFGAGGGDYWILKLTPSGQVEWQRTYGGALDERAKSILPADDGGYLVSGYADSFGAGESDFWILKLNSSGDIEWQRAYGGSKSEYPSREFDKTSDGGYIIGGWTSGSFGAGGTDVWILKLTSVGDIEWQRTYGGINDDWSGRIQETWDGGYIVAAYTYTFGAGLEDGWVLKLSSNGDIEWQRTFGGDNLDYVCNIQETRDGGYIAGGATATLGEGGYDLWAFKLSHDGNIYPSCGMIGSSNASVFDTSVSPLDTDAIPIDTNVIPRSTHVIPRVSSAATQLHCVSLPEAPTGLEAKAVSWNKVKLKWKDNSPVEEGFKVERKKGKKGRWEEIRATKANRRQCTDKGLEANKLYKYRVCACNSSGYSAYSNVAKVKTRKK